MSEVEAVLVLVLNCHRLQAASMISFSSASLSGEDHAFFSLQFPLKFFDHLIRNLE